MNKLETITQLLVNELTDFEKNVKQLGDQIERAESLQVKFDVSPIKSLISKLEEFGRRETERRDQYLNRLERNLIQAKIYPKWAVITFVAAIAVSLGSLYFAYNVQSNRQDDKQHAYQQGINDYEKYVNGFFEDNPKAFSVYKKWKEKQ